jgi:ribosomal protein S18 acetylase RimI-like enzyme
VAYSLTSTTGHFAVGAMGRERMDYTIRLATRTDVPAVVRVARTTWGITYTHSIAPHNLRQVLERSYGVEALSEAIAAETGWFFVAAWAALLVGFAQFLRRADGQGELARIYVLPRHQRRGIGRAFLAAGVEAMGVAGIHACYVSAEVDNAPALAFYQRFGFRLHREYASFLGDQILRLVELRIPLTELQDALSGS